MPRGFHDLAASPHRVRSAIARRCGAIRTRQVGKRTTLLLVRARYHLLTLTPQTEYPLLAEECLTLAFTGAQGISTSSDLYSYSTVTKKITQLSGGDSQAVSPNWSPDGKWIAFTKNANGKFAIGVMKPDGSGERILTEGFHNEGPTWAPNGLFLMFFRDSGGGGGPKIYMVDVFGQSENLVPTPGYASDPAWGPLLP